MTSDSDLFNIGVFVGDQNIFRISSDIFSHIYVFIAVPSCLLLSFWWHKIL